MLSTIKFILNLFLLNSNIFILKNLQALRVSMEEQRQRQEEEARKAQLASAAEGIESGTTNVTSDSKEGIHNV